MESHKHSLIPHPEESASLIAALTLAIKEDDLRTANEIIEADVLDRASTQAHLYMGCLLKAFAAKLAKRASYQKTRKESDQNDAHSLAEYAVRSQINVHFINNPEIAEKIIANDIELEEVSEALTHFIQGDYEVRGRPPTSGVFNTHEKNHVETHRHYIHSGFRPGDVAVTTNEGDYLALIRIMEKELTATLGDADIAKKLAANTARLSAVSPWAKKTDHHGEKILVHELKAHHLMPFKDVRIFEFAGRTDESGIGSNPLIQLFSHYRNHTPIDMGSALKGSEDYINLKNTGKIFGLADMMGEKDKYDYVIASNVFCKGAARDNYTSKGHILITDVLPHLSNMLKDKGTLMVSNTAMDGLKIERSGSRQGIKIEKLGLRVAQKREPLLGVYDNESGLSMYERDYNLRPAIAFSHEEHRHDARTKQKNPHSKHLTKRVEQQERPHTRSWGME